MHQSQLKFSFPLLKDEDLLQCLTGLSFPITIEDLQNPFEQTVRPIYEKFVELFIPEILDKAQHPQFTTLTSFPHPELHDTSSKEILIQTAIVDLCHKAGISDFTLQDIYTPEYKKTKKIFSGLINFAKFREEKLSAYQDYVTQTTELIVDQQKVEEINNSLLISLEEKRAKRDQILIPNIESLHSEIKNLEDDVTKSNEMQASLQSSIKNTKIDLSELNSLIQNQENLLSECKKNVDNLTSQIVSSPKRVKEELEILKKNVENGKEELKSQSSLLTQLKSVNNSIERYLKKLSKRVTEMNDIQKEKDNIKYVMKQIKDMENEKIVLFDKCEESKNTLNNIENRILEVQNKLFNYQKQVGAKYESAQISLAQNQSDNSALKRDLELWDRSLLTSKANQIQSLQNEIDRREKEHKDSMEQLNKSIVLLNNRAQEYYAAIVKELGISNSEDTEEILEQLKA